MATSSNGYPVLTRREGNLPRLRSFKIPDHDVRVTLRDGSAGFLLVLIAYEWHLYTESLGKPGPKDEWGHAIRPIRGKTSGYSNHASGCAIDLNATRHPRGVAIRKTFTQAQINGIRTRLKRYNGCVGWGGNYRLPWNVDGMHFEITAGMPAVEALARRLMKTPRGQIVLKANPGLDAVIMS